MSGGRTSVDHLPPEDVKLSVGSYRYHRTLMHVPGTGLPFDFTLYYNAKQTWTTSFARKWSHSYAWPPSSIPPVDTPNSRMTHAAIF